MGEVAHLIVTNKLRDNNGCRPCHILAVRNRGVFAPATVEGHDLPNPGTDDALQGRNRKSMRRVRLLPATSIISAKAIFGEPLGWSRSIQENQGHYHAGLSTMVNKDGGGMSCRRLIDNCVICLNEEDGKGDVELFVPATHTMLIVLSTLQWDGALRARVMMKRYGGDATYNSTMDAAILSNHQVDRLEGTAFSTLATSVGALRRRPTMQQEGGCEGVDHCDRQRDPMVPKR
ncbi:hypothetical protein R3P38DRAFT_2812012 [Favolaschia claudopus]|uniref:Uncharacterized protein n=1 Tax=Favolaschia claudopus TaxID=2862362 RepID=A0AAV9Z7X8_9AGAR